MPLPSDEVLSIWNRIMKYQVDFSFPLELPVYLTLDSWVTADRVLDLGSGDGYYATRLATYFPEKLYTCIDLDERAIAAGRKQFDNTNQYQIEFAKYDVSDYHGNFPVAIARLLVQHLEAPEDLLLAAPHFLCSGGLLLVIDSNDQCRLFWPPEKCQKIDAFFRAFSTFQPGRTHSSNMVQVATNHGFDVEINQTLIIPSSIPTYKEVFYKSYQLFFEIVQKHYKMNFDYDTLFLELKDWARSAGTYAQIGVNYSGYRLHAPK